VAEPRFLVRIWGARGSIPAPAERNCELGSDTCCVEMRCGDSVLAFDAGSGATSLSARLAADGVRDFDLFFTHCHLDHIIGLPFMKQLYDPRASARLYAGHFEDGTTCEEMVRNFMRPPYFPVTPLQFQGAISFLDFAPPDTLRPKPGVEIRTMRLNHPNGAVGYRVEFEGRAACYVTDTEHRPEELDAGIVEFVRDAEVFIYDCAYTDAEFPMKRGFGHSTWEEGVRISQAAGVGTFVIFHHDIGRDDAALRAIGREVRARFPAAVLGRTGLEIEVGRPVHDPLQEETVKAHVHAR